MSSTDLRVRRLRDRVSAPAAASPAFLTSQGKCEACPSVPPGSRPEIWGTIRNSVPNRAASFASRAVFVGSTSGDRRARIVRLTARGKEQAGSVFAGHKAAMDSAATGLSKTERAMLIDLLRKLGTSRARTTLDG